MWTFLSAHAQSWLTQPAGGTSTQTVLTSGTIHSTPLLLLHQSQPSTPRIWVDSFTIPGYAAALSILILSIRLVAHSKPVTALSTKLFSSTHDHIKTSSSYADDVPFANKKSHVEELGGPLIFSFRATRLLACVALLGLSVASIFKTGGVWHHGLGDIDDATWLRIVITTVYGYACVLAVVSISATRSTSNRAIRHLALILTVTWFTFAYRDLWPLATFTLRPIDEAMGPLIWVEIALLTVAAILVPFLVPRQYIPVDPKEPMPKPNPEQTASLLSLMLYNFLDSIILQAYRIPHLGLDKLPALADYDTTKHLVERSFNHLDPFLRKSHVHLFFGLMTVFRWEYLILATMVSIRVVTSFASPLGVYQLLYYLEQRGEGAQVRPIVWISWLFLGPVLGSVAVQWYIFIATGTMVRAQGIITQLIFDHALRIRVKADVNSPSGSARSTAAPTPDSASIIESPSGPSSEDASPDDDNSADETVATDQGSPPPKDKNRKRSGTSETGTTVSEGSVSSKTTAVEKPTEESTKGGNLAGKLNNLITTDLNNIVEGRDFLFVILYIPLQIALCVWFLYVVLGWSAFMGMASMILLFPIPGYLAKLIQTVQTGKMKKTDARVQTVTETMNVIRMIKLFGWEPRVNDQLAEKREEELQYYRKYRLLELANGIINFIIPCVTMLVTFSTFTVVMKRELSASVVFSSMAVFDLLRGQLHTVFGILPAIIQAKVSLDRINEFLNGTELLDEFADKLRPESESSPAPQISPEIDPNVIGFNNAAFTWSSDNDGTVTPGPNKRNFTLRITDELTFRRGRINLVVGATGAGKTSLLMALLGEMHYVPSGPDSYYNLPRDGGVAYASQESWVQNETIRENILFGAPYDEERYNKVIYQCGLKRDLTLFHAGDATEVGEKGLTLSGGQKARITLARAVYSTAQILLLDDVLAALDVHTAKWIVDKCFKGDLIEGRTVILVTHNIAMASPIADFVVSLGLDGRVLSQGSLSKALAKDKKLSAELKEETDELKKADTEVDGVEPDEPAKKGDGKLVVAEEIAEGHVGWPAFKLFMSSLGGDIFFLFWATFLGGLTVNVLIETYSTWFLGYWARQYEIHNSDEVDTNFYLAGYTVMLVLATITYALATVAFVYGCLRASRSIHKALISSVLGTTLRWLDVTPTSRVITRCTQDISAVDGPMSWYFGFVVELTISMLLKFFAIIYFSPKFLLPGILVAALGGVCGQVYIRAQLSVKREMSNARAPVLGHFGAAMAGLTSIRAYGAQAAFRQESYARIDKYTRAARTFYNLNRWICIRIESLGGLFASSLAAYLVYGGGVAASDTGFSLTMAVSFSSMILWWIRLLNEFEIAGNSLERIQQYLEIEQEPKSTPAGVPPAYWPASGNLAVEGLSAKYSTDGPKVLHEINFQVNSGERVGIVGRTGSGKSSLTLSLLRCIFTEGKVYYDGIPTDSLNLDALRSNITIIPQIPELLSGSLRENLDPFSEHDDAVLNDALRAAGLFSLQSETDDSRITLDSPISSGGGNLSVGQRQVLALARAIVRRSKLLILDEATSAIDYETDTVIQSSLRKELDKDVTLLTIAHRLQTIMDADKIMVLDAGRIVEFGTPSELLKNEQGTLRSLVDESGDKDALYAMVTKSES